MRFEAPFQTDDLHHLAALLDQAEAVVPMRDIADGHTGPRVIGLRHDIDNEIESAVNLAVWEHARGYRSTYFIEHTAPYWHDKPLLEHSLHVIASYGHELGLHLNAITQAILTGRDPLDITAEALHELRSYGHHIRGVVAHGDPACYEHGFVNDELFTESARPTYGPPDRAVGGVQLQPVSRSTFGLDYDPNWLPRTEYLSDSGGRWSQPFDRVAAGFPFAGQLHVLVHPCWWGDAFARVEVAA